MFRDRGEDPRTEFVADVFPPQLLLPMPPAPAPLVPRANIPNSPVRVPPPLTFAGAAAETAGVALFDDALPRRGTERTATALISPRKRDRSAESAEPMTFRSAQRDPVGIET